MPPRLQGWDYRTPGVYFVTACVKHRRPLFGHADRDRVRLSTLGSLVRQQISAEFESRHGCIPHVIMPDHIHLLVPLNVASATADDLTTRVRRLKANVTREARMRALIAAGDRVWQRGFFDRVVRNEREYEALVEYIATNPLRWSLRRSAQV